MEEFVVTFADRVSFHDIAVLERDGWNVMMEGSVIIARRGGVGCEESSS